MRLERLEAVNTVLIDRYGAPDEVARAVLTFPTASASSTYLRALAPPSLRSRAQVITPPAPHAASPLEPQAQRTYEETLLLAGEIARAGWPVIVDGSFSRKSERDEVRALADRVGVVHATIWCDAPDPVIAERLERRAEDAGEVSDGRAGLLAEHRARYEAPEGEPGVVRVDTESGPDIDRVLESLGRPV